MKLLLDEMWSPTIAEQVRRSGFDVQAVAERDDLCGRADDVVFALAQDEGRAVVTENVIDYRGMAAEVARRGRTHAGVVFTTNRAFPRADERTPGRLVAALLDLLQQDVDLTDTECWL